MTVPFVTAVGKKGLLNLNNLILNNDTLKKKTCCIQKHKEMLTLAMPKLFVILLSSKVLISSHLNAVSSCLNSYPVGKFLNACMKILLTDTRDGNEHPFKNNKFCCFSNTALGFGARSAAVRLPFQGRT